jgi:hypothetical protein
MNFYTYAAKPITKPTSSYPIVGQFLWVALLFAGVTLVIAVIMMLVKRATCAQSSDLPTYEPFEPSRADGTLTAIQTRIKDLRAAGDLVQDALDTMNDAADETCNIMREVEEVYVGNSSAPSDPSEFDLPAEIQKKRQQERERRGRLRFAEERKLYAAMTKKPVYECFSASSTDVAEAEQELSMLVNEITGILDTAEVKLAAEKQEKIRSLLNFNERYLKKAVNAATAEGFWADLKGAALLAKADELLGKAKTIYGDILALKQDVKLQRQVANGLTKKAVALGNGEFSQSDISAGLAAATAR